MYLVGEQTAHWMRPMLFTDTNDLNRFLDYDFAGSGASLLQRFVLEARRTKHQGLVLTFLEAEEQLLRAYPEDSFRDRKGALTYGTLTKRGFSSWRRSTQESIVPMLDGTACELADIQHFAPVLDAQQEVELFRFRQCLATESDLFDLILGADLAGVGATQVHASWEADETVIEAEGMDGIDRAIMRPVEDTGGFSTVVERRESKLCREGFSTVDFEGMVWMLPLPDPTPASDTVCVPRPPVARALPLDVISAAAHSFR